MKTISLATIECAPPSASAYACLRHWHTVYGPVFNMRWRTNIFPIKIYKYQKEWRFIYRQRKQYTPYTPFALEIQPRAPTHVHIQNIHKTPRLTGSTLMNFVLAVCRKLGARDASLEDAADVTCLKNGENMRLSVIQLLKKGQGFYERFGFAPIQSTTRAMKLVHTLQNIQLSTVRERFEKAIALLSAAQKDPRTFELKTTAQFGYPPVYVPDPASHIAEKLTVFRRIVRKLKASQSHSLAAFLAYSAAHQVDCRVYTDFVLLAQEEQFLVYQGKEVQVNKWAHQVNQLSRAYPQTMHITL